MNRYEGLINLADSGNVEAQLDCFGISKKTLHQVNMWYPYYNTYYFRISWSVL